jgi:hypothetical protein
MRQGRWTLGLLFPIFVTFATTRGQQSQSQSQCHITKNVVKDSMVHCSYLSCGKPLEAVSQYGPSKKTSTNTTTESQPLLLMLNILWRQRAICAPPNLTLRWKAIKGG